MAESRRQFLGILAAGVAGGAILDQTPARGRVEGAGGGGSKKVSVALVQCDFAPGQVDHNLDMMEHRAEESAKSGAGWILFPELTVCDYMDKPASVAERVPQGRSTARMAKVAARLTPSSDSA